MTTKQQLQEQAERIRTQAKAVWTQFRGTYGSGKLLILLQEINKQRLQLDLEEFKFHI